MGKIEKNKTEKRSSLLTSAYNLFVERGFNKTTISDIARESGLAKGTFYLYFKDKYDLRDELVARQSAQVLLAAQDAIRNSEDQPKTLEEYLIRIVDCILDDLSQNKMQLKFISKNLSWGVFQHAMEHNGTGDDTDHISEIYQAFLNELERGHYSIEQPDLLLFTIIELVSSTGFSVILYESPCDLDTYRPYLHKSIHQILEGYRTGPDEESPEALSDRNER